MCGVARDFLTSNCGAFGVPQRQRGFSFLKALFAAEHIDATLASAGTGV